MLQMIDLLAGYLKKYLPNWEIITDLRWDNTFEW